MLEARFFSLIGQVISKMQPRTKPDYVKAIEALNDLQSNAQYIKNVTKRDNKHLSNNAEMTKYLKRSGLSLDEIDKLKVIHVTGTNGKGTTCAYSESILRSHGYKTGFYSSPHLMDVRERIRINGLPISKDEFSEHFWNIYNRLDEQKTEIHDMPLYFRFLTIMALHVFLANKVDVAVLEVGIGGEFDCTNVVRKTLVAGITPLDIDHTALLGNTLESIAWNKSGIMKPGAQVFTASQPEEVMKVLRERSVERNCTLNVIEDVYSTRNSLRIPPHIQKTNANLAIALTRAFIDLDVNRNAIKQFSIDDAVETIENCHWPGRYEIIEQETIRFFLDGAHTIESIKVCVGWFNEKTKQSDRKRALVFNVTGERNPQSLLGLLEKCNFDVAIFVPNVGSSTDSAGTGVFCNFLHLTSPIPDTKDNISPVKAQLQRCGLHKEIWSSNFGGNSTVFACVSDAFKSLKNDGRKFDVLVTGSIHLIGAAMTVLDPHLHGTLD